MLHSKNSVQVGRCSYEFKDSRSGNELRRIGYCVLEAIELVCARAEFGLCYIRRIVCRRTWGWIWVRGIGSCSEFELPGCAISSEDLRRKN